MAIQFRKGKRGPLPHPTNDCAICLWSIGFTLEGVAKILSDECADFLAFEVVGVVIAGGEDVCSKDDAAFHFGAETGAAGFAVHAEEGWVVCAEAVTDAVVTGEVGGGFCGVQNIVSWQGVFGVGE